MLLAAPRAHRHPGADRDVLDELLAAHHIPQRISAMASSFTWSLSVPKTSSSASKNARAGFLRPEKMSMRFAVVARSRIEWSASTAPGASSPKAASLTRAWNVSPESVDSKTRVGFHPLRRVLMRGWALVSLRNFSRQLASDEAGACMGILTDSNGWLRRRARALHFLE